MVSLEKSIISIKNSYRHSINSNITRNRKQSMKVLIRRHIIRNNLKDIGIALVLVGVPVGMYLNFYFPGVVWSPVIMSISIILITSYKNLFNGKLPLLNKIGATIALFQLLMIIYGMFSKNMDSRYLIFHLYIIALFIALSTNTPRNSYESTKTWIFVVSAIATLLGAYTLLKGLITGNSIFLYREDDENTILEVLTMSYGFLINFIASLFLIGKKKIFNLIVLLFVTTDLYLMLFLGKRTAILIAFLSFIIFLFKHKSYKKINVLRILKYLSIITVILILLYTVNDQIKEQADRVFLNIYLGIGVIFGNSELGDLTGSAISRVNLRDTAYNMISKDFNFFNLLFGKGYMTIWLDNPLLQSYIDMGIPGLLLFFLLIIWYPILTLIKRTKQSDIILFAYLFTLYTTFSSFHSGNPYQYIKYTPIIILAYFVQIVNKERGSCLSLKRIASSPTNP